MFPPAAQRGNQHRRPPFRSPSSCFPQLPSAVFSTVDHHLGSPSLCFSQLPSAVTSTVDHPLGSPSLCFSQLPSAVTSTVDHPLGSPSLCFSQLPSAVTSTVDHPLGSPSLGLHRCTHRIKELEVGLRRLVHTQHDKLAAAVLVPSGILFQHRQKPLSCVAVQT